MSRLALRSVTVIAAGSIRRARSMAVPASPRVTAMLTWCICVLTGPKAVPRRFASVPRRRAAPVASVSISCAVARSLCWAAARAPRSSTEPYTDRDSGVCVPVSRSSRWLWFRAVAMVAGAGQGVSDDPGAGADGERVLAGQRGGHAAVGGQVGQVGQVVGVGGQRVGAELAVAVEGGAGGVKLGEQAGETGDQLGVAAGLVELAAPGGAEGQGGDSGRLLGRSGCGARHLRGEGERERFGAERRVRAFRGGEEGGGRGDAVSSTKVRLLTGSSSSRLAVPNGCVSGWSLSVGGIRPSLR
jgi:hypothetical protein